MTDVITIASSDEEDSPRPKRIKTTPVLTECTLTPIAAELKRKTKKEKSGGKSADVVELTSDSDDDVIAEENEPEDGSKTSAGNENTGTKADSITIEDNIDNDSATSSKVTPVHKPEVNSVFAEIQELLQTSPVAVEINNVEDLTVEEQVIKDENNSNSAKIERTIENNAESNAECPEDSIAIDAEDLVLVEEPPDKNEASKNVSNSSKEVTPVLQENKNTPYETSGSKTNVAADGNSSDEKENTESQNGTASDSSDKPSKKSSEKSSPSTSKKHNSESNQILFNDFIDLVIETVKDSKYEGVIDKKMPVIKKYFKRAEATFSRSSIFEAKIKKFCEQAKISPEKAVIQCSELFRFIKANMESVGQVDIDDRHILYKVRKLEKTMKLLVEKIRELDATEVDFDDEEKSVYIQVDRYSKRLKKVYEKYCQYLKKNPYSGRLTYDRLCFCESRYNEINLAINARYKNCAKCPEYYKIEKIVKKTNKASNLDLSDYEIRRESKRCFEKLATVLQRRRKTELFEFHSQFIENTEDPARENQYLEITLKKNFEEGKKKIDDVFETYVRKQEEKQSKEKDSSEESEDEESQSNNEKSSSSSDSDND